MTSIKESKRKAKQLDVPQLDDDPAERKRVLNVLAQRRYRRRKKEHLRNLENSVDQQASSSVSPGTESLQNSEATLQPLLYQTPVQIIDNDQAYEVLSPGFINWDTSFDICGTKYTESACLDPTILDAHTASFSFPLPSLPSSRSASPANADLTTVSSSTQQSSARSSQSPLSRDEVHLPMLELVFLHGAISNAKRLDVDSTIYDFNSVSPIYLRASPLLKSLGISTPTSTMSDIAKDPMVMAMYNHLPQNLQPTAMQLSTPHHAALDVLPWPAVRDKLILVFSQPFTFRPPIARSPLALLEFVYDLEDSAEGVRLWGEDPSDGANWEVGQKLFERWWWALTSDVIRNSNYLRDKRGANMLGTVLGEVE